MTAFGPWLPRKEAEISKNVLFHQIIAFPWAVYPQIPVTLFFSR